MARYYDWEAKRERMVEDMVADLMNGDAKDDRDNYNHLLPKNFAEFLQEMSADAREQLLELLVDADQACYAESNEAQRRIGLRLMILSRDYWEALAKERAEREVPTARELEQCEREDAAEARRDAYLERMVA